MADSIVYAKKNHIALITLNQPDVLNAMNPDMVEAFDAAVDKAARDEDIWVVVVNGAGPSFCSGVDLRNPLGKEERLIASKTRKLTRKGHIGWAAYRLSQVEKPTIAAVRGHAAGGGLGIALACDIRVAGDDAQFTAVFARRGLPVDSGTSFFLPLVVGYAKATELAFTTRPVKAEEALSLGLANQIVPAEQTVEAAMEMAKSIVRQAPLAVRMSKRSLRHSWEDKVLSAHEYEMYNSSLCSDSEDYEEGRASFFEKRPPVWKAR